MTNGFHKNAIFWVEVDKIRPNPYQPRKEFDEDALQSLAESIKQYGVLQPLVVTRKEEETPDGGLKVYYELVAGERRLRAAKLAGLTQVPVLIRDKEDTDQEKLELAIIENLQREDLNPIDRALAFRRLADEFKMTHAQIAQKIGKSREYVTNTLRLLSLPEDIQRAIANGIISEGHARPLLMLSDKPDEQNTLFKEITLKKLTVREAEHIARAIATEKIRKNNIPPKIRELEKKLSEKLGTRVRIETKDGGVGRVHIDFTSEADLEHLMKLVEKHQEHLPAQKPKLLEDQEGNADNPELPKYAKMNLAAALGASAAAGASTIVQNKNQEAKDSEALSGLQNNAQDDESYETAKESVEASASKESARALEVNEPNLAYENTQEQINSLDARASAADQGGLSQNPYEEAINKADDSFAVVNEEYASFAQDAKTKETTSAPFAPDSAVKQSSNTQPNSIQSFNAFDKTSTNHIVGDSMSFNASYNDLSANEFDTQGEFNASRVDQDVTNVTKLSDVSLGELNAQTEINNLQGAQDGASLNDDYLQGLSGVAPGLNYGLENNAELQAASQNTFAEPENVGNEFAPVEQASASAGALSSTGKQETDSKTDSTGETSLASFAKEVENVLDELEKERAVEAEALSKEDAQKAHGKTPEAKASIDPEFEKMEKDMQSAVESIMQSPDNSEDTRELGVDFVESSEESLSMPGYEASDSAQTSVGKPQPSNEDNLQKDINDSNLYSVRNLDV